MEGDGETVAIEVVAETRVELERIYWFHGRYDIAHRPLGTGGEWAHEPEESLNLYPAVDGPWHVKWSEAGAC